MNFFVMGASGAILAAWMVRRLRDAIRYRRGDRNVLTDTPVVNGWYATSHAKTLDIAQRPPPRSGAVVAQLRADLTSPVSLIAWAIPACLVAEGIQLEMPHLSILGLVTAFVFGRSFIQGIRLRRDAVLSQVTTQRLTNVRIGKLGQVVVAVPVELQQRPGSEAKVMVPWQLARTLLDDHRAIELLVGFDPRKPTTVAVAVGVRAPTSAQAVGAAILPRASLKPRS